MARRKTVLTQLQSKGPTLIFDSGNALFPFEGKIDDAAKPRAQFILDTMAKLGAKAMPIGARDLGAGATWLKQAAAKSGIKVLSANLKENGVKVFDGSTVVTVGGARVGLIGLSPLGDTVGNTPMISDPLAPALKAELDRLKGKTDLVILLAAVSANDALQLAHDFASNIDFVVRSGNVAGNIPAQRADGAWVMSGGNKGQSVVEVALKLDGKGPFVDLAELGREKELLAGLELKIKEFEPRLAAAKDPESKKLMAQTLADLKQRRADQKKKVDPGVSASARTFELKYVMLDSAVADEPMLKAEVLKYEPTYAGSH